MKYPPVFFAPPDNITDDTALLDATESHHLAKVMRLKKADLVILVDGLGMAYRCEVDKVGRNDACPCGSGKKYKKCCGK